MSPSWCAHSGGASLCSRRRLPEPEPERVPFAIAEIPPDSQAARSSSKMTCAQALQAEKRLRPDRTTASRFLLRERLRPQPAGACLRDSNTSALLQGFLRASKLCRGTPPRRNLARPSAALAANHTSLRENRLVCIPRPRARPENARRAALSSRLAKMQHALRSIAPAATAPYPRNNQNRRTGSRYQAPRAGPPPTSAARTVFLRTQAAAPHPLPGPDRRHKPAARERKQDGGLSLRVVRHRKERPVAGALPGLFEFRTLDTQQFAAFRIVHEHSNVFRIDAHDHDVVRGRTFRLQSRNERSAFCQMRTHVAPIATKRVGVKAGFAQIAFHINRVNPARLCSI